jgi:uncharacterized integral membrane protein
MGSVWLKIKVWTKVILVSALIAYVLLFILKNSEKPVTFWFWFGRQYDTSLLFLLFFTFLSGVLAAILVRTLFTTMRQIRELRSRGRTERMERDLADMKLKAGRLQTKPPAVTDHILPAAEEAE